MKYVFYDSESVDIKHKYSFTFGYLVTDDKFNIINRCEDIVFNPDVPKEEWDWWAYRNLLIDSYPQRTLQTAKLFTHYYNKIKNLFKDENVVCIGFEINEDVKYLLANCERYQLEPINFKYVDLRHIIKLLTKKKAESLALEYVRYTHKPYYDAHRSSADAEMTMLVLKELLKKYKTKLKDLIYANRFLIGKSNGFEYGFEKNIFDIKKPRELSRETIGRTRYKKLKEGREDYIDKWSVNELLFTRFLDFVQPTCEREQILKDKKISISLNYELYNFNNMLKIIQMITNAGGTYVKKGSLSNIFVKQPNPVFDEAGNARDCNKYKYVMEAIETEGKEIKIMEFDEFLSMLGLSNEELDMLPRIDVEYLKDNKYKR